jgi:hypothetical protein
MYLRSTARSALSVNRRLGGGPVPGLIRVEDRDGRLAITTVTSKGITARSRTASASTRALSSARIVASPTAYLPVLLVVPHSDRWHHPTAHVRAQYSDAIVRRVSRARIGERVRLASCAARRLRSAAADCALSVRPSARADGSCRAVHAAGSHSETPDPSHQPIVAAART